jgi:hypothetical protein
MSIVPKTGWHVLQELQLYLLHGFSGCESRPVGNAKNMRIHRDGGLAEGRVQNHVSSFSAHAGQLLQLVAGLRNLAPMMLNQQLARG